MEGQHWLCPPHILEEGACMVLSELRAVTSTKQCTATLAGPMRATNLLEGGLRPLKAALLVLLRHDDA